MPDLYKATGENVQEKAADELHGVEGHLFDLIVVLRISPSKAHAAILKAQQPPIGNRHSMGVSRQIPQDLLRSAERRLGVDHPFLLVQGRWKILKAERVSQFANLSVELQATQVECLFEISQKLAAK